MSDKPLSEAQAKEIADALDRVVRDLPWGQSIFLTAIGNKFEQIRDQFKQDIGQGGDSSAKQQAQESGRFALQRGQRTVFVSLYNAQGSRLPVWQNIISNLPNQSVSRPIYSTEKAVKSMIRAKQKLINEAYVEVVVNDSDILMSSDQHTPPKDKLGNVMLTLKERAITVDRILRLYHQSGIYELKKHSIRRIDDMNFADDGADES